MLRFLIDENLNQRIVRGLKRVVPTLDYAIAQEAGLKAASDSRVLQRAAAENRVLVTHDLKTIPRHAYERVGGGESMPGVVAVPNTLRIGLAIEDLAILAECCEPAELDNLVLYLPLWRDAR